jgi:Domain of unknown function (DUF4337)
MIGYLPLTKVTSQSAGATFGLESSEGFIPPAAFLYGPAPKNGGVMDSHEVAELAEEAQKSGSRRIGVTIAALTAMMAFATNSANRAEKKNNRMQHQAAEKKSSYHMRELRAHEYILISEIAALHPGGTDQALSNLENADAEYCGTASGTLCHDPEAIALEKRLSDQAGQSKVPQPEAREAGLRGPTPEPSTNCEAAGHLEDEDHKSVPRLRDEAAKCEDDSYSSERKLSYVEMAELLFEMAIAFCSLGLLVVKQSRVLWGVSLGVAAIGFCVLVWSVFLS